MLSSKQRAALRAIANREDTILYVGKSGITPNIEIQARDALRARELIKGRVLENSLYTAKEAAEMLADMLDADVVQTIGSRFVIFKRNPESPRIEI